MSLYKPGKFLFDQLVGRLGNAAITEFSKRIRWDKFLDLVAQHLGLPITAEIEKAVLNFGDVRVLGVK